MFSESQKKLLEKQQYRFVGEHSAVKICGWTKKWIKGEGGCYKYKFYGIRSHQCLQMSTSMFCANRCIFCWRDVKAPVSKDWYGKADKPDLIIRGAIREHLKLLQGMRGNKKVNPKMHEQWKNIKHAALSLTGEPITYPLINEIIDQFYKRRISTFLVTNGQYSEQIENLKFVTQLYISVDAPDKKTMKKIDKPLFNDYYERLLKSLEIMSKKEFRTCIRITVIKGLNDFDLHGYKKLIELGKPDFVEVKAYMLLGASRNVLRMGNMPYHSYIVEFSKKLVGVLSGYDIVDEHKPSRVVLLVRKSSQPFRYIHFKKFFEGKRKTGEYGSKTMQPN